MYSIFFYLQEERGVTERKKKKVLFLTRRKANQRREKTHQTEGGNQRRCSKTAARGALEGSRVSVVCRNKGQNTPSGYVLKRSRRYVLFSGVARNRKKKKNIAF